MIYENHRMIKPVHFRMYNGKMQIGFKGITYRILWRNVIRGKNPDEGFVKYDSLVYRLNMPVSDVFKKCMEAEERRLRMDMKNKELNR